MKKKNNKKTTYEAHLVEQDEHYFFIAGYTEGGFAYGTTWEEAIADGLINEDRTPKEERGVPDESLPF